jgi:hypothetical protein
MSQHESRKMSGWDQVISGSQEMLEKVEAKAKRLRANIEVAKEAKRSGEAWLKVTGLHETQPKDQKDDACHSV